MASIPNGMVVYHTYFKESAYAHSDPKRAAAMISEVTPGNDDAFAGTPKKVPTNWRASAAGRPALIAYAATYAGTFVLSLLSMILV